MPCVLTWLAYFFASSQGNGVPRDKRPIGDQREIEVVCGYLDKDDALFVSSDRTKSQTSSRNSEDCKSVFVRTPRIATLLIEQISAGTG